jgi:hypothetical protein
MSHWIYNNEPIEELPQGVAGFIYKITNMENGKMYIGRKYAVSVRRKALTKVQKAAGRKRKEVVTKESDWAKYTGSSKVLNEDIKTLGKDKFKFEILMFGNTKGVINYLETNIQHKLDVILSDKYYNDVVGSRDFMALRGNKELKELLKVN